MINNPVTFSIDYLADVSKDIPNMVVQLSFLVMSGIIVMVFAFAKDLNQARKGVMTTDARGTGQWHQLIKQL